MSKFTLVSAFASIFIFVGEFAIGLGTAFIGYMIMTNSSPLKEQLYSYIVPTIVI